MFANIVVLVSRPLLEKDMIVKHEGDVNYFLWGNDRTSRKLWFYIEIVQCNSIVFVGYIQCNVLFQNKYSFLVTTFLSYLSPILCMRSYRPCNKGYAVVLNDVSRHITTQYTENHGRGQVMSIKWEVLVHFLKIWKCKTCNNYNKLIQDHA